MAEALTKREREVLELVAQGFDNDQIRDQLNISVKTVEFYRGAMRKKLGIQNVALLTRYAIREGWFKA